MLNKTDCNRFITQTKTSSLMIHICFKDYAICIQNTSMWSVGHGSWKTTRPWLEIGLEVIMPIVVSCKQGNARGEELPYMARLPEPPILLRTSYSTSHGRWTVFTRISVPSDSEWELYFNMLYLTLFRYWMPQL